MTRIVSAFSAAALLALALSGAAVAQTDHSGHGTTADQTAAPPADSTAAYKAANEIYDRNAASNPKFKKLYDSYKAFRGEEYLWFQVAEYAFDTYMIRARTRG